MFFPVIPFGAICYCHSIWVRVWVHQFSIKDLKPKNPRPKNLERNHPVNFGIMEIFSVKSNFWGQCPPFNGRFLINPKNNCVWVFPVCACLWVCMCVLYCTFNWTRWQPCFHWGIFSLSIQLFLPYWNGLTRIKMDLSFVHWKQNVYNIQFVILDIGE